jgi:hypothetical protein
MTNPQLLFVFTCVSALAITAGCTHKNVPLSTAGNIPQPQSSYVDLEPGWKLRIVVPLLKSEGYRPVLAAQESNGKTISLSSADLLGYTTSYYAITGKKNGIVRLKLISTEETKEGKTVPRADSPSLPFELPHRTEHIRLIYLVRASHADHNMVIIGSKQLEALDVFTKQLQENSSICNTQAEIFCSWIPTGVAVRPEKQ